MMRGTGWSRKCRKSKKETVKIKFWIRKRRFRRRARRGGGKAG